MRIWHYHRETGALLGEDVADPSPLEPGTWLIPAHATAVEPPPAREGFLRVWTGEAWQHVPMDPPAPPRRMMHAAAFLAALTPEQELALAAAAQASPAALAWLLRGLATGLLDLDDPRAVLPA